MPAKGDATDAATVACGPEPREYSWQEMLRTPQFYLMWIMYALAAGAGLMVIGIVGKFATTVPPINAQMVAIKEALVGGGLDWLVKAGVTYTVVMAVALGNGAGRPITGIVSDRIGRTSTMMAVFLVQALMMVALVFTANYWILLIVVAAVGFNYGANLTLFPAMTCDYFGTKNLGVNYGLVFTAWGAGGVLGSLGSGWIFDAFKSFNPAFYIAAVLLVVATGVALLVRAPRTVANGEPAKLIPSS